MKLGRIVKTAKNLLLDLRYGQFLGGVKQTPYADRGAHDTANSDYEVMPYLFNGLVEPEDIFIDIGCGKGRVLNWWLSHFPAHKLYGIELDPEVALSVQQRLSAFDNVDIICGDVGTCLPMEPNVFYLFNPFDASVMRRFKDALTARYCDGNDRPRRPLKIVYYNPVCKHIFEEDLRFSIRPIDVPSHFHSAIFITLLDDA